MAISIPWFAGRSEADGRIGLSVGPDGMAVAHVDAGGTLVYCQFIESSVESNVLLAELVKQRNWQGIPTSLALHPIYYQLLLAEKPPVEGSELPSAVRWKVKDLLDFPLEEAAIEHFLLPEDAYRGRQKMLYAAVLRKTTLQSLVEPVEASGLPLDCIEVSELALHNIISRFPVGGGGIAMVQLNDSGGLINLEEDGAIYLSRRLDIGLDKFEPEGNNTAFFDELFLEIQRSLDYYESQLGKGIITRLFYAPGIDDASVIGDFLSAQLGLNVAPLDVAALNMISEGFTATVAESVDHNTVQQVARSVTAIGAALGPKTIEQVANAAP